MHGNGIDDSSLKLTQLLEGDDTHIIQGLLQCSRAECSAEFPIIDGIPILVRDVQTYVSENLQHIIARTNLSPTLNSLIGDCCGPGSLWDTTRHHLSSYCWDHYGEFRVDNPPTESSFPAQPTSSIHNLLEQSIALYPFEVTGPLLDVGCSCGRASLELAKKTNQCTLGIDLNFSMLRLASQILRTGSGKSELRHLGTVYHPFEFELECPAPPNLDFWAVDILEPPFSPSTFHHCFGFNVLDAVRSPVHLLESLDRLTYQKGTVRLSCPYDWSSLATPPVGWFGGHSQRAVHGGDGPTILKNWLATRGSPFLQLIAEDEHVTWQLRLHARSMLTYSVHLMCLQK